MKQDVHVVIRRVLHMLNLLSSSGHTSRQLAKRLGVSERTIWRYLKLIRELGFKVVKKRGYEKGYHLDTSVKPDYLKWL